MTEELCGAVIVAGRLMDAIGASGLSADMERPEPGLHMLHCVLPKGHHPLNLSFSQFADKQAPAVICCRETIWSPVHSPGHMLDQSLFLPPEPPKCGARWFTTLVRSNWFDLSVSVNSQPECILVRGHAGGHEWGLGEWR